MVERRMINGIYEDEQGLKHSEEFMTDYFENAFEVYKEIIEYFNNTLISYESRRKAISAEWFNETKEFFCEFIKTNSGTLKDSVGFYDRVKCVHCGKVKRRRRIDSSDIQKIKCKVLELSNKQRENDKE